MAALDNLNAAVTGSMMGDQLAEQQLLSHLQTMNQTLTAAAPIFETARQIPIATTLGKWNIAQAGFQDVLSEEHRVRTEQERSQSESIAAQSNLKTQLAQTALGIAKMQHQATLDPNFEKAIKNYKSLESFLDATLNRLKLMQAETGIAVEQATAPGAPQAALSIQAQTKAEADAAAAAAAARRQAAETMTQRFLWQPSLMQRQTGAEARYNIEAFGRKTTAETQANIRGAQQVRAGEIELVPQEAMITQFQSRVKADPTGALNSLNAQMAPYKSAVAGYPLTNSLIGQLGFDIVHGDANAKSRAQQSLNDLDQGIRNFNYFKGQGLIPTSVGTENLYGLAYGLSLAGQESAARVISDIARNQVISQAQLEEQEDIQAGYGMRRYFYIPQSGTTEAHFIPATDTLKLLEAGKLMIQDYLGFDTPQGLRQIQVTGRQMLRQGPSYLQSMGYGWAERAAPRAETLAANPAQTWLQGDKRHEALAAEINSMPISLEQNFINSLSSAKAAAAAAIGKAEYQKAEADLRVDADLQISLITNGKMTGDQSLAILNQYPTGIEQIREFDRLYPTQGRKLQTLATIYQNTQIPYNPDVTVDLTHLTNISKFKPAPPVPTPQEKKQQQQQLPQKTFQRYLERQ